MKSALILLLLAGWASSVKADLSYTQTTQTKGTPGKNTVRISWKGKLRRIESINGPGHLAIVEKPGASKVIVIDTKEKIYAFENSLFDSFSVIRRNEGACYVALQVASPVNAMSSRASQPVMDGPRSKVTAVLYQPTENWAMSQKVTINNLNSRIPFPPALTAHASFERALPVTLWKMFGSWISYSGPISEMKSALAFVPLRTQISYGGSFFSTTDTTGISTKILPASLFAPPRGYRQVSEREWRRRRAISLHQAK